MTPVTYRIAGWLFDPREPVLRGPGGERRLEDRAARVLALLCRRRGDVVSKEDMIAEVWGGRSVSANSVSIVIGSLRRALDDDPRDPVHLVTVGRRGYRLAATDVGRGPGLRFAAGRRAAGLAVLAAVAIAILLPRSAAPSITIVVETPRNATGLPDLAPVAAALLPVVVDGVGRLRDVRVLDAASAGTARVVVRSSLILWDGAPELAITATDARARSVIWTGFAAGPPAQLARHVTARLRTLQTRLPATG